MNFPAGFLGTRADVLVDIVVVSQAVFIPLTVFSYLKVKALNYRLHRNIQVSMAAFLSVVVTIFEWDIRTSGGILKLAEGGRFSGTQFLKTSFAIHLFFSGVTSLVWLGLIALSVFKFANPPVPNSFSSVHRIFGRIGMLGMLLTAVTGIQIYCIGFAM